MYATTLFKDLYVLIRSFHSQRKKTVTEASTYTSIKKYEYY
jgi:hypothetical protein